MGERERNGDGEEKKDDTEENETSRSMYRARSVGVVLVARYFNAVHVLAKIRVLRANQRAAPARQRDIVVCLNGTCE